jgi:RHS repeat-associated protein
VSPSAKNRYRSRLSCRRSATQQTSIGVPGFRSSLRYRTTSEVRPAGEARKNARGVCVARWYDPGTGQFMSVDPELAETDQPYAYAGDDPVNEADLSGLSVNLDRVQQWAVQNLDSGDNGYISDDCTDFASRALHGGGMSENEPGSLRAAVDAARFAYWTGGIGAAYAGVEAANHLLRGNLDYWYEFGFYGAWPPIASDTWGVAHDLYYYLTAHGGDSLVNAGKLPGGCPCSGETNQEWNKVTGGDIIFANQYQAFEPTTANIDHTGVVLGWGSESDVAGPWGNYSPEDDHLWIAQHGPSVIESLDKWNNDKPNIHEWIVDPNG